MIKIKYFITSFILREIKYLIFINLITKITKLNQIRPLYNHQIKLQILL
jgi:hypothetical protein